MTFDEIRQIRDSVPLKNADGNTCSSQVPKPTNNESDPKSPKSECPICKVTVSFDDNGLNCDRCYSWLHASCLFIEDDEYKVLDDSEEDWFCDSCRAVRANRIVWGSKTGEDDISSTIKEAYQEIIGWKKNFFKLPRGKSGTNFIKELTRLIYLFVENTKWGRIALSMVHIFVPLMLQKPSKTSKAKDHARYLLHRLEKWGNGDLSGIMEECREIQKRLTHKSERKQESSRKAFCRLMLQGKVGQAIKFINNEDSVIGVHKLTEDIKNILSEKHPKGEDISPEALLPDISCSTPQPVMFEGISSESIQRAARALNGSGGPTHVDADTWKYILCSKAYGKAPSQLADAMASVAKRLCVEEIHPEILREYNACRLIPLDKGVDKQGNPGVRPIGIGEVFRRIIGKTVVGLLREDIVEAAGPLQTCAGLKSGIEASIHATKRLWDETTTEAIIQVDADNAFNRLNRKVALHNIKQICPPFYRYLNNHYQEAARLVVNDNTTYENLMSEEGCTQGDVAAMALYALGIKPLVDILSAVIDHSKCKQSWYADDSSAGGLLDQIKVWWDKLCEMGPKFGYFPKASKTVLILRDPALLPHAKMLFAKTGVQIITDGQRHLGAVIGSDVYRKYYVSEKVDKWIKDVKELAAVATEEPQAALAAFTKGIQHRWTFVQRTIPDTSELFQPLEDTIREDLIPSIVGRKISDVERSIFSLPVRHGGLGIANPVECSDREYQASTVITEDLADLIYEQAQDLSKYDQNKLSLKITALKSAKENWHTEKLNSIIKQLDGTPQKRALELTKEKGSGSWLTALPLKDHGYCLNKIEFKDAICLRYGWKIPNTPSICGCGMKNDINHTLICKKGGYVSMRHNNIRDINADFQREVCRDVATEPSLIPLDNEEIIGTEADGAAPDISSRGMWSNFEKTFFDVCVTHPNSPSYSTWPLERLYRYHEDRKMKKYNSRVINVEKGSFTPLIYSTSGGWGPQAAAYHKRLAQLLSKKRNEEYADVMGYMRTKIRFSILRSTLIAVRGERGRRSPKSDALSSVDFNLIPEAMNYECY